MFEKFEFMVRRTRMILDMLECYMVLLKGSSRLKGATILYYCIARSRGAWFGELKLYGA